MFRSRSRIVWWSIFALGVLCLLLGGGALAVRELGHRAELEAARQAMSEGRFAIAQRQLARLAMTWTGGGEADLLLGECELARGRREEALAAWARVSSSSRFFGRAALLRATHLINSGRYLPAEEVLIAALQRPDDATRYELERALCRVYRFEGRFDDVRRVIRASWYRSPEPAATLKELWTLDHSPMPVESWNRALSSADDNDDRVWLGRAANALLTGRFAAAADWLDRCLRHRQDDPVVWRTRLDLALATDDVANFRAAAEHLPADQFTPAERQFLRAWAARQGGDAAREMRELEALIGTAPGDAAALERLALLNVQAGKKHEAEELHRRKAKVDQAQDQFRKALLDSALLVENAEKLAQFAVILGRTFDAEGWAIVADAHRRAAASPSGPQAADGRSFLPADLERRASELCQPFSTLPASPLASGPKLAEQLSDLKPTLIASRGQDRSESMPSIGASSPLLPYFTDDAEAVGLRFTFDNGQTPEHLLPETMAGGIGLLDYDGDGWMDVYCVQGGPLGSINCDPPRRNGKGVPEGPVRGLMPADGEQEQSQMGDVLFHNRGDGKFEDVTRIAGIARLAWGKGYGLGVAVGDYDNDGHPDLFVSRLASYALYRNQGDGTFEDVTEQAGLAGRRDNPTSAAFADLDNDGDLDLYVCHYMLWDPAHPNLCKTEKGDYFYCDPSKVEPAPDHVFRNDGGRFVDVTASSGLSETQGRGLGVVAADLDDDNRIDLYVANDGTANYLFKNLGGFRFREIALEAGAAGSASGGYQAGMGVACGDLDGDGRPDLLVTNFYGEGTTLYGNLGDGLFADKSAASGIGLATRYLLGFGIALLDVNNRGRLDVMITNGHVNDNRPYYLYSMPCRLYENRPNGKLVDISAHAGGPWAIERVGRGLAAGDLDNDGRIDAVVLPQNSPVAYFHNKSPRVGNSVVFLLEGTKSNRDGVGARVTVTAGGRRQVAQRMGGGSYQSANDPRLHFGLGPSERVESVEVRWPSGKIDRWNEIAAGAGYRLKEGKPLPQPLAGFRGARHRSSK
jgi:tetratricopeptide (TPR) repeat protein/murein DD-endopeptidase MepM/ murein hydrolase activator NlpD